MGDKLECGVYDLSYEDTDLTVPVVVLGDGSIEISDIYHRNGFNGIGFSIATDGRHEVGRFIEGVNQRVFEDTDYKFMILSDNPDSLQVIINRLSAVRDRM